MRIIKHFCKDVSAFNKPYNLFSQREILNTLLIIIGKTDQNTIIPSLKHNHRMKIVKTQLRRRLCGFNPRTNKAVTMY